MDQFGQEVLKTENGHVIIPRAVICKNIFKQADSIVLLESSLRYCIIKPHIPEKTYTEKESLQQVKYGIWTNLFNFGTKYAYSENRHYPHVFSVYLKNKLNIDIISVELLDLFIERIRNAMFIYVTYTCPPNLISAANWISKSVLRLEPSKQYVLPNITEKWLIYEGENTNVTITI